MLDEFGTIAIPAKDRRLLPGHPKVGLFYREPGGDWQTVEMSAPEARALADFLRLALVDSENDHRIAVNILAASDVRLDGAQESRKIEIARLNLELIGNKQCTDVRSYLNLNTPKNYLIDEMDLLYLKNLTEKLSRLKAV